MAHAEQLLRQHSNDNTSNRDNSLQGKALERALGEKLPRTLTPYEWQQWYAEHGKPAEHTAKSAMQARPSWWQRLRALARPCK